MTPDYWNRQIERWMDIFSDDEPDLMGLELVREFDNMTKRFYRIFDGDLNESEEDLELHLDIRSEMVRDEVHLVVYSSSFGIRPKQGKVGRKVELVPVPTKGRFDNAPQSRIRREEDSSEDIIVNDKNVKVVSQLPINNKKENIKVVAYDDNAVTVSHLNSEGKQCTRTLDIQYSIDFGTAKATYKNGILEIIFNRK